MRGARIFGSADNRERTPVITWLPRRSHYFWRLCKLDRAVSIAEPVGNENGLIPRRRGNVAEAERGEEIIRSICHWALSPSLVGPSSISELIAGGAPQDPTASTAGPQDVIGKFASRVSLHAPPRIRQRVPLHRQIPRAFARSSGGCDVTLVNVRLG